MSSKLFKEMIRWQECSNGTFKLHTFPYDWRRELQFTSGSLELFIEDIYARNGGKPVTLLART